MNYGAIKKHDIANGPGVRVSLFVSGCRHRCQNCFNSDTWDFNYGQLFTESTAEEILNAANHDYITGLSLLGGEPLEPENRDEIIRLAKLFRKRYPHKSIWCYTGFTMEEIFEGKAGEQLAERLLPCIDVLVDGRFIEAKKDLSLLFRGSSNQRILDAKRSLESRKPVLLDGVWKRASFGQK